MKTYNIALMIAALLGLCIASPAAPIIINGGFEGGTISPWQTNGAGATTLSAIPSKEGSQYVALSLGGFSADTVSIWQNFSLATSTPLTLEFFAQRMDFAGIDDTFVAFDVRIDSTTLSSSLPAFSGASFQPGSWTSYALATPGDVASGNHTLTFTLTRGASLFGRAPVLALDGVSVVTVPEPSSAALLGAGAAIWIWLKRRR